MDKECSTLQYTLEQPMNLVAKMGSYYNIMGNETIHPT